ncbi:MAG TPA: HAD family hydrolase, partial [Gammaproteobacteria bacterium]|nr:HAD family hydrolase [Gammaproteobacteria bacterium]
MTHLVMFDIDGTLVDSMGFDTDLYVRAVRAELGDDVEIDETWRSYRNATDSGILDEILAQRGFGRPADEIRQRVQRRFVELVGAYLARNSQSVREIPGALALIETLLAMPGVRVAIASGGWAETALMKLRAAGFPIDRLAVATSSDARERTRIMQIAEGRA